jgi:hypothetical protein
MGMHAITPRSTLPHPTSGAISGISSNKGHVHVMFIFRDPTTTAAFDDSLELGFKLPIRADEDEDEE